MEQSMEELAAGKKKANVRMWVDEDEWGHGK